MLSVVNWDVDVGIVMVALISGPIMLVLSRLDRKNTKQHKAAEASREAHAQMLAKRLDDVHTMSIAAAVAARRSHKAARDAYQASASVAERLEDHLDYHRQGANSDPL